MVRDFNGIYSNGLSEASSTATICVVHSRHSHPCHSIGPFSMIPFGGTAHLNTNSGMGVSWERTARH